MRFSMRLLLCASLSAAAMASAGSGPDGPSPASRPSPPHATTTAALPADPQEFAARRAKLQNTDVEGLLTLARWARDRAMWNEAADVAESALFQDPGNRAAYLILQQVDQARPLPDEPEVEE